METFPSLEPSGERGWEFEMILFRRFADAFLGHSVFSAVTAEEKDKLAKAARRLYLEE